MSFFFGQIPGIFFFHFPTLHIESNFSLQIEIPILIRKKKGGYYSSLKRITFWLISSDETKLEEHKQLFQDLPKIKEMGDFFSKISQNVNQSMRSFGFLKKKSPS